MTEKPKSIVRLQAYPEITSRLQSLSVCDRCLLRIAGETYAPTLRNASSIVGENLRSNGHVSAAQNGGDPSEVVTTSSPVCPCCFGLLQEAFCSLPFLERIQEHVRKSGHTMRTFWCSLTAPSGADIRARQFDEYWDEHAEKISGRLSVKDAWKAVVTPVLTGFFKTKWVGHDGLEINLTIENKEMDGKEAEVLKKKYPQSFQEKRGPDGVVKRVVTRHALEKILASMRSYDFNLTFPFPPTPLSAPSTLTHIACVPCSVFVAGRYLKYSRCISQTPWFIEEERKGETSIEELICRRLEGAFGAESSRFCASGREDIDVLMLGDGRPFGVELIGAKYATRSQLEMARLEDQINASHKDIQVRYLTVVERSEMSIIKMGEEEKTKTYSALCSTQTALTPADFALLNHISNLQITQRTPVRVLHRRANGERLKKIYEVSAETSTATPTVTSMETSETSTKTSTETSETSTEVVPGSLFYFRLSLKTQAGTYIKEFVHGDFGRTTPSVSSLLNREVECEELDVTSVDLVWPPGRSALSL